MCRTCKGAEYLRHPSNDPFDPQFGSLIACPDCKAPALEKARYERLLGQSGLEEFRHVTFENTEPRSKDQEELFQAAFQWAYEPTGWLWLYGGNGLGKTRAAKMVGNVCLDLGRPVFFRVTSGLLREIKATFSPNSAVETNDMWDAIFNIDVLILDEFMRYENPTQWTLDHLFELLNYRHERMLPTIVTTNKPVSALDPALQSRVREATVVKLIHVGGTDGRSVGV